MQDGALNSFASGGTGPYTYLWNGGQTSSEILALDAGVYIVVATDAHGCTVSTTETLLEPSPHEVDLGDDLLIHLGDYIDLTAITSLASNQILDFTWSGAEDSLQCPYCDQYRFQPKGPGCETVLVRSKKGCKTYDTVCYKIDRRKRIYVPNVFSPNGDGDNDFFTIFSDASVKEILSLSIYNRWGGQLYLAHNIKTNDEPAGWNGTFKGQDMNIDVFVWVAEVEFIDGERIKLSGDVTLVR
jgi:gliding motility-associated-like protein